MSSTSTPSELLGLRSVCFSHPFRSGHLTVIALELYNDGLVVQWREVHPTDFMATEQLDVEHAGARLMHFPMLLELTDDVGTRYTRGTAHTVTTGREVFGRQYFQPTVPDPATRLYISAENVMFDVPLRGA